MSRGFSDGYQYSAHNGSDSSGRNPAEFEKLSQTIASDIQKIAHNVVSMQKMVYQIGTAQDSESLRQELHNIQHYTGQLAKDTNQHLKNLTVESGPEHRQNKLQKERLTNDFSEALKNLQSTQRMTSQKEKESIIRARANSGLNSSPFDAPNKTYKGNKGGNLIELASPTQMQSQEQMISLQMEEEVNLDLLREREQAVRKLESDITDVNGIFKDLAAMVYEQGEIVDSIESSIEATSASVTEGVQHLAKARDSQTSARKKTCLIIFIVVIALSVLALILGLTLKS